MAKKKLDDETLRTRILDLIRSGSGRAAACETVGISPATFLTYYKANPWFKEELYEAEAMAVEPVLRMLRVKALDDLDTNAAKEYLKHVAPPPRSQTHKVEHDVTHAIDASTINSIAELQERVRERLPQLAPPDEDDDIIDAEILE